MLIKCFVSLVFLSESHTFLSGKTFILKQTADINLCSESILKYAHILMASDSEYQKIKNLFLSIFMNSQSDIQTYAVLYHKNAIKYIE